MGLVFNKIKLGSFLNDEFLRLDEKYRVFAGVQKYKVWDTLNCCPLSFALKELNSPKLKKGELENEYILIDLANIERRGNSIVNAEKTHEIGSDKSLLKNGDIFIPKIEPKKGQFVLNTEHSEYLGSTELVEYVINKNNFNPLFLYYLLVSPRLLNVLACLESGKTHKRVNSSDLLKIQIPKISLEIQNAVAEKIALLETNITDLKNSKLKPKDIINRVFSYEFNIHFSDISSIDSVAKLNIKLSSISPRNNNLRDSFRWNKMQHIQNYLYKDIDCIHLLGNFIIETKNGWSPLSVEGGEGIPILGQEHFSFDGTLKISPSKFTEVTKKNIDDCFIQQGDFFVSRGNTVDLVALASVVEEEISEDIIFPDLYIKIQLDETRLDKKYLALLFNSFFGRLYFKYASKGKNQTMVKISSSELYDFYLPIPDIEIQKTIVKKIQAQIDAQSLIDQEIEKNRAKINLIIEEAIRNPVEQGQSQ